MSLLDDLKAVEAYDRELDRRLRARSLEVQQELLDWLKAELAANRITQADWEVLAQTVIAPPDVAASILDYLEACLPAEYPPHLAPAAAYWRDLLAMVRELTAIKREVTETNAAP